MSGISKIITSIEPDEENHTTRSQNRKSKLGLQPIVDEAPNQAGLKPIDRVTLGSYVQDETNTPSWIKKFTALTTAIWMLAALYIVYSLFQSGDTGQVIAPLQWAGILTLTLVPLIVIGLAYFAMKHMMSVSDQASQLQRMAQQLSQPDQLIVEHSETMAAKIAEHVDLVNSKLNESVGRISALEDVLQKQASSVAKLNSDAKISVESIGQHVQAQKMTFDSILTSYDDRMQSLSEILNTHADDLTEATRIAEQKIKEARISVEGATSKINDVSDTVRSNTIEAAATLSGSHAEIKSLGDMIKERSNELDEVYKKHANDLSSMIEHLRDEQKTLGSNMEETLVKMRDLSLSAQASAESLSDASSSGKETIQALAQSASLADDAVKTRFAEMEQMVRYSTEHAQNINTVASQRVQDSLEQTRAEIARIESDMAGLQEKLQRSGSDSLQIQNKSEAKRFKKKRKPRVNLKPADVTAKIPLTEPETVIKNDGAPESSELDTETKNPLDLHVEETDVQDVKRGLESSDPILAAIRPVADYEEEKKPKSGFSLRGLFGAKTDEDEVSDTVLTMNEPNLASPKNDHESNGKTFIHTLTKMGLSPNVLVDDGCVIEAANSRVANGHEAMSRAVIARLSVPVKHFAATLSADPELSKRTIDFATNFDQRVEEMHTDREAIRTHLESEKGRAYLICDAALNYGRV